MLQTSSSFKYVLRSVFFFFSSRRRHTRLSGDWSSDVCSSDLKQGSYIPSVRPGKGTEKYISRLLIRLSTVGALFLGAISIIPIVATNLFGLPKMVALGGTSLLILISTAIQGAKQLEGYMLKRQYKGFMDDPINKP